MNTETIGLWILGGFLGSGKTTLLNRLLAGLSDYRVGVVVNDFGKLGVDASLVEKNGEEDIIELNGGQIFCSCISGNFVKSLEALSAHPIDIILVESSGLAKPSALKDIVGEAERASKGRIEYRGFVSILDAERSLILLETINAVEEQISYADLIVINKTDLASLEQIEELQGRAHEINPSAAIITTAHGELEPGVLPRQALDHDSVSPEKYQGWGSSGRPKAVTWLPKELLSPEELEAAVSRIAEEAFRIKGYVPTEEGLRFVSASGAQISIQEIPEQSGRREGLTVIVPPKVITAKLFKEAVESVRGEGNER